MTAASILRVSKEEFFDFVQRQAEGKYEYDDGLIVQQMTGGTNSHATLITRLVYVLMRDLDTSVYSVTSQSRGVNTPRTIRYPDVLVEAVGASAQSLSTSSPLVIVEVLSPGTEKLDLNVKPPEYASLSSLQTYVVVNQDQRTCRVWQREADGDILSQPQIVSETSASIPLPSLGIVLRLDEIYRGIA
jgi:Uma2 family endonuclease